MKNKKKKHVIPEINSKNDEEMIENDEDDWQINKLNETEEERQFRERMQRKQEVDD